MVIHPMGPSRRVITRIYTGLAIGVLVFGVLVVWPGFITTLYCPWSIDPTTSVNGTTYCYQPEPGANLNQAHYDVWEFEFSFSFVPGPAEGVENVTITEPQGVTYSSGWCAGCPFPPGSTFRYFTPDGQAGFSLLWHEYNLTLYVEK